MTRSPGSPSPTEQPRKPLALPGPSSALRLRLQCRDNFRTAAFKDYFDFQLLCHPDQSCYIRAGLLGQKHEQQFIVEHRAEHLWTDLEAGETSLPAPLWVELTYRNLILSGPVLRTILEKPIAADGNAANSVFG